jgi:hypothetical protein
VINIVALIVPGRAVIAVMQKFKPGMGNSVIKILAEVVGLVINISALVQQLVVQQKFVKRKQLLFVKVILIALAAVLIMVLVLFMRINANGPVAIAEMALFRLIMNSVMC